MLAAFKAWASVSSLNGTKTVVQLCHPGPQIAFNKGTIPPSAVPMGLGNAVVPRVLNALVFGTPRAMTVAEIKDTVRRFANAPRVVAAAGFAGVELHAAHGYLLTQFLSSRSNIRTDAYGGNATARTRIVVEIIHAIREAVPPSFCVGLKLNSVDVAADADLEDCVEQLRAITDAGIEFLEVNGGSFEDPMFSTGPGAEVQAEKKASTLAREAFFIDFSNSIRTEFPEVPLLLTGGVRSHRGAVNNSVLVTGADSRLGIAIVRRILRQSDLAKGQYGRYMASMADSVTKELGNVETAETINKRAAAGSLPQIQAIVLNSDWEE
ncbi:hypothetical protein ETB97_001714 [Aspergillus alliaceus]|uniref:NADH:flavin oxidoreductase/NADH oxidase N-terminal domain-containing protein n=1 Tax=Petromyces alliaceus TaxID=209559 RepID=A0A8H6A6N7_PETAA|nr:hypothetical protein ETB97_001714 [Aspergillus burnettii]